MCNSRGFAALPTELLHHIASHIQETTIPWYHERSYDGQRRDAFCALSQLCRSLRVAFLPLVWQNLEAYTLISPHLADDQLYVAAQIKAVGKQLLGRLRLVRDAKQPYASYIRIIAVAIYSRFTNYTLTKLAGAMALMPNLHTIQLMCDPYGGPFGQGIARERFQRAFSGLAFPSVKRVIFPGHASAIFECFPEAVEVFTNQPLTCKFIDDMFSNCPKVETIGWKTGFFTRNSRFVLEKYPNLRRIECYMARCDVDEIMQLLPLNREKITLICDVGGFELSLNQMVEGTQQVLARSSFPSKCLEVVLGSERRTIDIRDKPS